MCWGDSDFSAMTKGLSFSLHPRFRALEDKTHHCSHSTGRELTPPHSLMLRAVLNALSIPTSRNLIQRQTSAPGGREHVQRAAPALLGDPGPASQRSQLPSFPTVFRRAKRCRLYENSLLTINDSMQHSLQIELCDILFLTGKAFPYQSLTCFQMRSK